MQRRQSLIVPALIALLFTCPAPGQYVPPEIGWQALYSKEGILVEKGEVAGSPYHAFRGTGMIDAGLGRVISVLYDHARAKEWVHQLRDSKALRVDGRSLVVWQRYDNPIPVRDRDFIYFAKPEADLANGVFEARFIDVVHAGIVLQDAERAALPDAGCCVRGTVIHAAWIFQAAEANRTCVRVEVVLDPKGIVPTGFVNRTQKKWPFETIAGLRRQVGKTDIILHPEFGAWTLDDTASRRDVTSCAGVGD